MNQILVIRFSTTRGFNPKLREALAGTYDPFSTPAYAMPMGGYISVLVTEKSFEEILQIVQDADCGEPVQITDCGDVLNGIGSKTAFVMPQAQIGQLSEEGIQAEIARLMVKQGDVGLSVEEADLLTRLLSSEPR